MNTDQILEKIREFIKPLLDGQAHIKTAMEALKAGQDDLRETMEQMPTKEYVRAEINSAKEELSTQILAARAEAKLDILNLDVKLVKKVKQHDKRIDELEKERGLPNPNKN